MYRNHLSLPREAAKETILVLFLDDLTVDNGEILELARRNTSGVQNLDISIAPVLSLWF